MARQGALHRVERNIDAIEIEIRQMRHSLRLFLHDPGKYEPQLDNLAQAALNAKRSAEVILRAMGVSEED